MSRRTMTDQRGTSRCLMACVAVIIGLLPLSVARAGDDREYEVKAAFIYNFIQFVQWPESPALAEDAPLTIAVVGESPIWGPLDKIAKLKKVGSHPLELRHFRNATDVQVCQVLFVGEAGNDQLDGVFRKLGSASVLTVGETDQFIAAGGIIRFIIEENKVRFEIDVDAAQHARLKISSKLLKLARLVKKAD